MTIIHLLEDIENEFISNILEAILEIRDDSIVSFLEILELRVTLAHFIGENLTDDIDQDIFQGHLITVFILETSSASLISTHSSNGFVCSLYINWFNITNGWLVSKSSRLVSTICLVRVSALLETFLSLREGLSCRHLSILQRAKAT